MREIKFRAWDKDKKKMRSKAMPTMSRGISFYVDGREHEGHIFHPVIERFEVMQFTGERDKNEQELWEGDIIRYTNIPWDLDIIRPIVYRWGSFGIQGKTKATHITFGNMPKKYIEKLGNIYKDSDLLGGDNETS